MCCYHGAHLSRAALRVEIVPSTVLVVQLWLGVRIRPYGSIGVNSTVFLLNILHLCLIHMLDLLNSLRLLLDGYLRRHLLRANRRLHRHAGLEGHTGCGVSACLWGLHGALTSVRMTMVGRWCKDGAERRRLLCLMEVFQEL